MYNVHTGIFEWSSGVHYNSEEAEFNNFEDPNLPDGTGTDADKDCIGIDVQADSKWKEEKCDRNQSFICIKSVFLWI